MIKYNWIYFLLILFFTIFINFRLFAVFNLAFAFYFLMQHLQFAKLFTIQTSKFTGFLFSLKLPIFLRKPIYKSYIWFYNVNLDEILEKDLENYKSINEFFIRDIIMEKRPVDKDGLIVSPCDGKILSISPVDENKIMFVKGMKYDLLSFLYGSVRTPDLVSFLDNNTHNSDNSDQNSKLYQVTIYLSPADCHKYFSPCNLKIEDRIFIPGALYPVIPKYVNRNPRTFLDNERVTLKCKTVGSNIDNNLNQKDRLLFISYVGAFNVGSIFLNFEKFSNNSHNVQEEHISFKLASLSSTNEYNKKEKICQENDQNTKNLEDLNYTKEANTTYKQEFDYFSNCPDSDKSLDTTNNLKIDDHTKDIFIQKSEDMGYFKFGSTIVLIFDLRSNEKFCKKIKPGNKIQIGNKIIERV